jgi:galactokinase
VARTRTWRAPGRVNIIGEHIDYLGGQVLPFACDLEVRLSCVPADGVVHLSAGGFGDPAIVTFDSPRPGGWHRHVWGVVKTLMDEGFELHGIRGEVTSNVPVGAGLSSSTALEVAVALAITDGAAIPPEVLQRAEQLATGIPCGVMDQTTILRARAGHALLLNCATGRSEHISIPGSIGFVVIDTGTRRELSDGRYAQRRAEVEGGHPRRLRHADGERRRVLEAVDALRAQDISALGALVTLSHESLRDDFEVSSPELDRAVGVAEAHPACTGARLVGGGFAGCALAVVEGGTEADVSRWVEERLAGSRAMAVKAVDAAGEVV